MTDPENAPAGYASIVHPGPLKPVLIWRAPHEYVVYNILVMMVVTLMLTWRWVVITVFVHLALMLFWFYDPHLLPAFLKSLSYHRFYGTK